MGDNLVAVIFKKERLMNLRRIGKIEILLIPIFVFHILDLYWKGINLDERFLLNSGRVALLFKNLKPQNLTWATLLGGSLITFTKIDYFYIFFGFRILVLTLFYLALYFFSRSQKLKPVSVFILFFGLAFSHSIFFDYIIQPRYDTFIYILLIFYFVLFQLESELSVSAAFLLFLISFSGMKGVFYCFVPVGILGLNLLRRKYTLKKVLNFTGFFLCLWSACFALLYLADLTGPLFDTYVSHFKLATQTVKDPEIQKYYFTSEANAGLLFYMTTFFCVYQFLKTRIYLQLKSPEYLLVMGFSSLLYCCLHPRFHFPMLHPFHLALILSAIFFLVKTDTSRLQSIFWNAKVLIPFVLICFLQIILNPFFFFSSDKLDYFYSGLKPDIQKIKYLEQAIPIAASVFDPTSFVLNRKPCIEEWYLDHPYNYLRLAGQWQINLDLTKCDYVIMNGSSLYLGYESGQQLFSNFEMVGYFLYKNKAFVESKTSK